MPFQPECVYPEYFLSKLLLITQKYDISIKNTTSFLSSLLLMILKNVNKNKTFDSRNLGWRLGLQSVTGALSLTFFLGLIYRSASLYHPQRRAIVHLKNQRTKVKEKKNSTNKMPRQPFVDLSPLGSRPVRMLMLAAGSSAFGLYTPAFYIVS